MALGRFLTEEWLSSMSTLSSALLLSIVANVGATKGGGLGRDKGAATQIPGSS